MNDSFGRISSPSPTSNNSARGGLKVQILSLPSNLQNNVKALRLEGQITQLNNNGSVRISTPAGDIEVSIKGNRQPQRGQPIEIEIPAGRPPRQASIRDISVQSGRDANAQNNASNRSTYTAPNATPPNVPRTNITDPQITSPVPTNQRGDSTTTRPATSQPLPPVPSTVQETTIQTAKEIIAQTKPLEVGNTVRFLSVPPVQAQNIATEYVQGLPAPQNTIVNKVAFTANLIAQNVQENLSKPLIQLPQNNVLEATPKLQNILQNTLQPIADKSFSSPANIIQLTPPTTDIVTPKITTPALAQTIPAAQTLPVNTAVQILQPAAAPIKIESITTVPAQTSVAQSPQPATITSLPINFDPTNPASIITSRAEKLDIQIIRIVPPTAQITLPNISAPTQTIPETNILPAATKFTPPLLSQNSAPTITAQVTGFTQQGLPLITAQLPGQKLPQSFILQYNGNNLSLGTQLQIIPKTNIATPIPTIAPQAANLTSLLQGFQFPALDELYNNLVRINPQTAASLAKSLPNVGNPAQTGAAAMMFIAAIKSGNIGSFLGQNKMDIIQKAGREDILSRLTQRPTTAQPTTIEPASSGDWRAVPLPMFWEGEIHRITLFTRKEQQQSKQNKDEIGQTRFIFDLSLSRMGNIQLDGLLRDKRLDLVIRAENAFSASMQQTMRQAYTNALSQTDLSGELNFQGSTKNWVRVLEQKEQLGVDV